jgi:hypothetical protein
MNQNVKYALIAAGLVATLYLVNQDGAIIAVGGVIVGGAFLAATLL